MKKKSHKRMMNGGMAGAQSRTARGLRPAGVGRAARGMMRDRPMPSRPVRGDGKRGSEQIKRPMPVMPPGRGKPVAGAPGASVYTGDVAGVESAPSRVIRSGTTPPAQQTGLTGLSSLENATGQSIADVKKGQAARNAAIIGNSTGSTPVETPSPIGRGRLEPATPAGVAGKAYLESLGNPLTDQQTPQKDMDRVSSVLSKGGGSLSGLQQGGGAGLISGPATPSSGMMQRQVMRKGGKVQGKKMRGGGLARKGVGMALAAGGLAKRAGGCAKRGIGRGKMV